MTANKTPFEQLEQAFKQAYAQRERVGDELSARWRMDVMRDIRRIGPLNARNSPFWFFEHFVWRFATAACALVFILSVYVGLTGWNPVDDVAALYFSNPVEFTVAQALGDYDNYE